MLLVFDFVHGEGGGNHGVGRSKDHHEVQQVKKDAVADCQSLVATGKARTFREREATARQAVVEHGTTEIVTFDQQREHRCYPSYNGYQRKNDDAQQVKGLQAGIAEDQPHAAATFFAECAPLPHMRLLRQNGFGLFTQ